MYSYQQTIGYNIHAYVKSHDLWLTFIQKRLRFWIEIKMQGNTNICLGTWRFISQRLSYLCRCVNKRLFYFCTCVSHVKTNLQKNYQMKVQFSLSEHKFRQSVFQTIYLSFIFHGAQVLVLTNSVVTLMCICIQVSTWGYLRVI